MQIINPVLRIPEAPNEAVLAERLATVQRMMARLRLGAVIFERRWLRSDRWMNNLSTFGADSDGWYVVPSKGMALATDGFVLAPNGHAQDKSGLALYAPDGSLVNWLTDCDLLDMLGDHLTEDGMYNPPPPPNARPGNARLVSALGDLDLAGLMGENHRLGVVCPGQIRATLADYLNARLPELEWVDVTSEMIALRVQKAPEELDVFARVARQHDKALAATAAHLRLGMTEREAANDLRFMAYRFGGAGFNWKRAAVAELFFTDENDTREINLHYPGRELREGDRVSLSLRAMGPGGYYGAVGRCFIAGEPTPQSRAHWAAAVALSDLCAEHLASGVTLRAVRAIAEAEAARLKLGRPTGPFIHCLGYAAQEPPLTCGLGEDVTLAEGTVLAVAPPAGREGNMPWICMDMYVLEKDGARRLTHAPRTLTTL